MIKRNLHVKPTIASVLILMLSALAMFSIFVISCGSSSTNTTPTAGNEVEISGFAFNPENITISAGTTVTWTNKDAVIHTVTSDDEVFDSGNLSEGDTFEYTFNQTGTFEYHCIPHPYMTGKVVVE